MRHSDLGRRFGLAVVLVFALHRPAWAQRCTGSGSLNSAPLQLGGSVGFSQSARIVGVSVLGGRDPLFVFGAAQHTTLTSATNVSAPSFGGGIGSDVPLGADQRVHACLLSEALYTHGPTIGATKTSGLDTLVGGQFGVVAVETTNVSVIPTAGVGVQFSRTTLDTPTFISTTRDTFGVARFGVGVLFNRQFAIVPMLTVPFALVGGEATFSIGMTYNF